MKYDADAAVIGLGTMGSLASWRLAAAGLSVVGFEQFGLAHDRGAAGGDLRRVATHSMGDPREVPIVQRSLALWRDLEEETGTSLVVLNGGLVIGPPDAPGLIAAKNSCRDLNLPNKFFAAGTAQQEYPQHYISDQHEVLFDPNAGYIRAQPAVLAALTAARNRGARLYDHRPIRAVECHTAGVTVYAGDDAVQVGRAVIAAGPWISELLPQYSRKIQIRRVLQAWFMPYDVRRFEPGVFPVFQRTGDTRVYGFPTIDGATIKMGILAPVPEVLHSASNLGQQIYPEQRSYFHQLVGRYFPLVHPEAARISAYVEGYTKSMQGVLGEVPDMPGVFAMGGFSGTGFKFAPAFAESITELAGDKLPSLDVGFLSAARALDDWETPSAARTDPIAGIAGQRHPHDAST